MGNWINPGHEGLPLRSTSSSLSAFITRRVLQQRYRRLFGESRIAFGVKGTPQGDPTGDPSPALWRENDWYAAFEDGDTPELRIKAIATFIAEREKELTSLLEGGGQADIYVFVGRDDTVALVFDASSLAILGRLAVISGIEVVR
jgi:hypothetical protein